MFISGSLAHKSTHAIEHKRTDTQPRTCVTCRPTCVTYVRYELRTFVVEGDVDKSIVDVVLAGRQVERAPVVDSQARQLGLTSTSVAQRLFPEY